jgi:molybdenum cofactor cytidylyltransferase
VTFAAIILAAGTSRRMGAENKLLADLGGAPLIARTIANVATSQARPLIVVTGHMGAQVRAAIGATPVRVVHNPQFGSGMASSLRAGLTAVPPDAEGALVMLGDMPLIPPHVIDRLIAAAAAQPEKAAIIPTVAGEWAHPVLLRRLLFAEMSALGGDAGARRLLMRRTDVATLAVDESRCLMDADDPAALAAIRAAFLAPDTGAANPQKP